MNGNAVSLGGVCIEWHISLATRNGDTNYQLVKGERTTVVNRARLPRILHESYRKSNVFSRKSCKKHNDIHNDLIVFGEYLSGEISAGRAL